MGNTNLFFAIFGLSHKYSLLDGAMVFGAEIVIYLTLILIFYLGLKSGLRERKSLLMFLLSIMLTGIIVKIIHFFIYEPRPFATYSFQSLVNYYPGAAFPSVHSAIMSTIAFSFYWYKSKWSYLLLLLMLWVGFARIYIGVHYPLDILGGYLIGFGAVFLAHKLKKVLKRRLMI